MNPEKIGKFIYELRTENKLSQYQLADMIPISRQAVSKWERGQTIPDSSTLIRLSDIFHVTINELLKGERLSDNTIKDLETTTLSIVDESNKKTQKIRRIIVSFIITNMIFIIAFLSYYFINSYNTIKVYTIGANNDKFAIYEGIFITAKQKTYMKLGRIIPNDDIRIDKVKVFYKKGTEIIPIFENEEPDIILIDTYGYQEYFPEDNIKNIIKNTYIEITYNDTKKDTIQLTFKRDFVNNFFFFTRQRQTITEINKEKEKNIIKNDVIEYIKSKGIYQEDIYMLEIMEENCIIRFSYHPSINQIIMSQNNITVWTAIMSDDQKYICYEKRGTVKYKDLKDSNCKKTIQEDIQKYLSKTG